MINSQYRKELEDPAAEIELHTAPTPNGWKVSIALEEMKLPYAINVLSFREKDTEQQEFLEFSPNGRIPAIIDRKEHLSVFESGAILIYLAERTGKFLPVQAKQRKAVMEWLMFQMSGIGPNFGQAFAFKNFPTPVPKAYQRFAGEAARLCSVLDNQLVNNQYVAGDYSIADMALYPWVSVAGAFDIHLENFPNLNRWLELVASRSAVVLGRKTPEPYSDAERQAIIKATLKKR